MAKASPVEIASEDPYALAAAEVVRVRAGELIEHADGVLDVERIERLHAMRVTTRRLRAALEIFEPCFERKPFKVALKEVKRLADALGERRDRDVTIAALRRFARAAPEPDAPGVESLIERLERERDAANRALEPYLEPAALAALEQRLEALARSAPDGLEAR